MENPTLLRIDDLIGHHVTMYPRHELVVGRGGDFVVGADDAYLHRQLFQLWFNNQSWVVRNIGSRIALTLVHAINARQGQPAITRTELPPSP